LLASIVHAIVLNHVILGIIVLSRAIAISRCNRSSWLFEPRPKDVVLRCGTETAAPLEVIGRIVLVAHNRYMELGYRCPESESATWDEKVSVSSGAIGELG
jgi:hypothetical protein